MFVCQCNFIAVKDIETTVKRLLDDDPWQLVVPVQVYYALGKSGHCCSCFPDVVDIIVRVTQEHHLHLNTLVADVIN